MFLRILFTLTLFGASATAQNCSIIDSIDNFDMDLFIENTWFVQRQQITSFSPEERLFCSAMTFAEESRSFGASFITMEDYSNVDEVNGRAINRNRCLAPDPEEDPTDDPDTDASKYSVSRCFFPSALGRPFWIASVALDYRWAVIVGGQPDIAGECDNEDLCTTRFDGSFFGGREQGLWFLSRDRIASDFDLGLMLLSAASMGLCTAEMEAVEQTGCEYEGLTLNE